MEGAGRIYIYIYIYYSSPTLLLEILCTLSEKM